MALPTPDKWTLEHVNEAYAPTDADRDLWGVNRLFYDGDHLQNFRQWIGPMPTRGEPAYDKALGELERGFVSRNAIAEVSERHASGVFGKEPHRTWGDREQRAEGAQPAPTLAQAAEMTRAWRTRDGIATTHYPPARQGESARPPSLSSLDGAVWDAVVTMLLTERAVAYLYVPPGALEPVDRLNPNGPKRLPTGDEAAMLDLIRVRFPDPSQCGVYTDPDTLLRVGVYRYSVEVQNASGGKEQQDRADLCWVDKEGFTWLRQVGKPGTPGVEADGSVGKPVKYDFGGRLPIIEMRRPLFITEQVKQAQRAINLALSAIPLNVIVGGWLDRVLINAQIGEYQQDAQGKDIPGTYTPAAPIRFGPRRVANITGRAIRDKDGNVTGYATPGYQRGEPVSIKPSEEAADAHYHTLLAEVDQLHVLITAAMDSSGVALQQARAGFLASLRPTAKALAPFLVALEETPLAMAEGFSAGQGRTSLHRYTKPHRASVALKLDGGPITEGEKRILNELGEAGRLSDETVLAGLGVDDVEAEMARLRPRREARRRADLLKEAAEYKNEFSVEAAVTFLREHGEDLFSETMLESILRGDFEGGAQ